LKNAIGVNKLKSTLALLRFEGSDNQRFEVKAAAGGFPESIINTLCAFANTPGGGVLILGVDEKNDFKVVGVFDPKTCQQTLANNAKSGFNVAIELSMSLIEVGDKKVVWAEVFESDKQVKPVKLRGNKRSFIRLYDGDFELSELDEQMFIAARGMSQHDEEAVAGTSRDDLNQQLVESFIQNRKEHSRIIAQMSDDEVLLRTGVVTSSDVLTKAGLFALGKYPQQFFPNYSIKASVRKQPKLSSSVRAMNVQVFDGPIPTMLDEALEWVKSNSDELVLNLPSGHVRTVREYLPVVVRELIGNALIHRAVNSISMTQDVSLIIEDNRLIISNPGGLYGIHVNELGRTGSVTRNSRLADICQYVRSPDGMNIIEKLGSGIPMILAELAALDIPSPRFIDGGIYFTVILASAAAREVAPQIGAGLLSNTELIVRVLKKGPLSKVEIHQFTGLSYGQVKYALAKMMDTKLVTKIGKDKSPDTKYVLTEG